MGRRKRAAVALVTALVGIALAAFLILDDGAENGDRSRNRNAADRVGASASPDGDRSPGGGSVTVRPAGGGLALGTLTVADDVRRCPAGSTCNVVEVSCPGLQQPIRGFVSRAEASGDPRGLVMFFGGGPGKQWYSGSGSDPQGAFSRLQAEGFEIVQVRWGSQGWLRAGDGEEVGPAQLACRPATVVKWVHDTWYEPLGVTLEPGVCGFCLTGTSGGASQIAYALTHFGLAEFVDAAILTSGPPHAGLAKGCLPGTTDEAYLYPSSARQVIDGSYGARGAGGPCATADEGFAPSFERDSIDTGGSDYEYPGTRVHFIVSPNDETVALRARDLADTLRQAGSPWVGLEEIEGMGHDIQESAEGMEALVAAVLARP
jgi:hypothetical protein